MLTDRSQHSDSSISTLEEQQFLVCESISGFVNESIHVGVSESKIGRELITDSLKPCQGVLAKLKNDLFSIYHAFNTLEGPSFQQFISSITDVGVEFVIIFQKDEPAVNKEKAPFLAINLAKNLNCKVKRIHVNDHTGIYVNAETKQIVLFKDPRYEINFETETKIQFDQTKEISIEQISLKESVNTLLEENKTKVMPNGDIQVSHTFTIPGKFLSRSANLPIKKSDETASKSASTSSIDENKIISTSDKTISISGNTISAPEEEKRRKSKLSIFRPRASSQATLRLKPLDSNDEPKKKIKKDKGFKVFLTYIEKKEKGKNDKEEKEKGVKKGMGGSRKTKE